MSKRNKIIYWIATLWLSLGMLSTGIVQLLQVKAGNGGLDSVQHLGYPAYIVTLLGVCKILGVIVVLVPKFPVLKEWAYAGFFFMMTVAIFSHVVAGDTLPGSLPALLLLVLTVVSWYFRSDTRKMHSTAAVQH